MAKEILHEDIIAITDDVPAVYERWQPELEFSKSVATGEVKIPSFFFNNQESICKHVLCKTNTLQYILKQYRLDINNTIAVGDSESNLCMVKNAGIGVAFCSNNQMLNFLAAKKIDIRALKELLDFA